MDMSGERVLVTGGARRLGKAVALAFAEAGADVVVHYHDSEKEARATAAEIEKRGKRFGVRATPVGADLSKEGDAAALIDRLSEGNLLPSVLINSASVYGSNTFAGVQRGDLERDAAITAYGPLELSRRFAELAGSGSIVNILDARMVDYDSQHLSYHLAKRTLFTLTRILAVELAPAIRVNGVAPGIILPPDDTPEKQLEKYRSATLLQTTGGTEDITRTVLFLVSSPFITGDVIFVDGGRHLRGRMYGE